MAHLFTYIEYIPKKTKEGRPLTVRVPLNDKAHEILNRYKTYKGPQLLPFISEQKYNKAIKEVFKIAGVNRIVVTLDPLTREEVKRPIYEVASSHMARRTFIGNIYRKVKDPNLVSVLSGVLLLKEPFTPQQAAGALLIIAGVYIAGSTKPR